MIVILLLVVLISFNLSLYTFPGEYPNKKQSEIRKTILHYQIIKDPVRYVIVTYINEKDKIITTTMGYYEFLHINEREKNE